MATGHNFTEEELELLSEEERAGLLEDEDTGDAEDAEAGDDAGEAAEEADQSEADASAEQPETEEKKAEGKEEDDDTDDDGDDDAADPEAEKKAPASEGEKAEADANADTGADADDGDAPAAPDLTARYAPPEGAKERIDAIKSELAALAEKVDDGEITAREYREQSDKLVDERDDLRQKLLRSQIAIDTARDTWSTRTVPTFLAAHPEYKPGSIPYRMLDEEVRRLQTESGHDTDPAHLRNAHAAVQKRIKEEFGIEFGAKPKPKPTPGGKEKQRREIPPTLADIPATDIGEADDGEFAHLANLKGEAYESALAKLSPDALDRYLETSAR